VPQQGLDTRSMLLLQAGVQFSMANQALVYGGDPHLSSHINCLELRAVFLALREHFLPKLRDYHVLVHTDNTLAVCYINH